MSTPGLCESSADVAIIGSGFAGSLTALALRSLGYSVLLLERGRHPRFAIGESSTPLANLLLEELSDRYGLTRVRPLSKWGTWQRQHPDIGCGLKRGFSFFRHTVNQPFRDDRVHAHQLLVAASPHDEIGDTHWYRPDVDAFLVQEAEHAGAAYLDNVALAEIRCEPDGVVMDGSRGGRALRVRAGFVIDASGTRGFLHRALDLAERPLRWLPPTQGLYTHFTGVGRFEETPASGFDEQPPFPVDAAALHHVFPGGWIWVLRFASGITSAGAAVTDPVAAAVRLDAPGGWERLMSWLPSVQAQFRQARPLRPFVHVPRLAFRSAVVTGPRWALLPSAAGVIDPLLSTGFPLTLLGILRLTRLFERHPPVAAAFEEGLAQYGRQTLAELDATEQLVGALYASMEDFERFKRLALLYFAAASYSETVRRLGRYEAAHGFLLCDDPIFGPELRACAATARAALTDGDRDALFARIDGAVRPFDVAGLGDRRRRDWYPYGRTTSVPPRRCLVPLRVRSTRSSTGAASLEHTPAVPGRHTDMRQALGTRRSLLHGTAVVALAAATVVISSACRREPTISDENYREAVVAFYTGLAALETSQEVLARRHLERVTAVAPHEPAAWANIGLLLLRQQELDAAAERLTKAAELAPDTGAIQRLLGLTESRRGNLAEATRHWRRALVLRADDDKAAYALALDLERQGSPETLEEAQRTLDALAERTGNVVARLEYARIAAKRGDGTAVQRGVTALAGAAAAWPADIQERLRSVQQAAGSNPRGTGPAIAFLKNVLMRLPEYRRWLAALSTPREEVGQPIDRFLVLPNPTPQPAAADEALTFAVQVPSGVPVAGWAGAVWLGADGPPLLATWDGTSLQLGGRSVWRLPPASAPAPANTDAAPREGIVAADLNYDFKTDLVVTSARGLTLLRQQDGGTFTDVTAAASLPAAVRSSAAAGAWAADVDTDGDLDVVTAPMEGAIRVLRNNGDGTFAVQEPFAGAARIRGFVWADADGDGVPDAALLDAAGVVRTYINARGGTFRERPMPASFPKAVALAAAEVSGDSVMDVLALAPTGAIVSLSQSPEGRGWRAREVARVASFASGIAPGAAGLLVADLDNNGAADLVATGSSAAHVLLRGPAKPSRPLAQPVRLDARAAADMDGDGRVDLVGLTPDGHAATAKSRGRMQYAWQTLRPHAATATGDQRINSFGIGGEVELRTGLHVQKRLIAAPVVHVGIGTAKRSEVVRIVWPNGTLQSEFDVAANGAIPATQRLKGSCPWLFAWNGREMAFVTDVLWRSPLGLRINAQQNADVLMTEDWVRVRGDQLRPLDGAYDLRITAELWETHFFDLASLLVLDHPAGTEVFVDERFAVPPPALGVTVTGPVEPVAAARDDRGADVTAIVRDRDDRHLDSAGRGAYQGVTREHFVEVTLPDSAPRDGPLWLVAQGWIHPTDSSINVAIGQGGHERPRGLRLAVADRTGRFRTVRENLGFPAGKDKTVLIDLARLFAEDAPRRLRLITNMEIFWDRLGWAVGRPDVEVAPRRIPLGSAELQYRGYSRTPHAAPASPERPLYEIEGTTPRWLDLEGYHTRFGDVRELLLGVDDRYVIMNAGDELRLRFPEAAPPPAGSVRDFVMITDGWEKDGDFNTTFSRTVLPLPTHRSARYDQPPGRLEDDPVYKQHQKDFVEYHTRYVTPDAARHALTRQRDPGQ